MVTIKKLAILGSFILLLVSVIPAPVSASDSWLSSVISAVTMVLNEIPEWNKAIDKMTAQAERNQFKLKEGFRNYIVASARLSQESET